MTNLTEAYVLAKLVLEHWEESRDCQMLRDLHQKEPRHILRARAVLALVKGKMRWSSAKPARYE